MSAEMKSRVYVQGNNAFRLPANGDTDVIMCGHGIGIAPFRASFEERKASAAKGRNWLFSGNPPSATDYLYQDEIEGYFEGGTLAKLDVAWLSSHFQSSAPFCQGCRPGAPQSGGRARH